MLKTIALSLLVLTTLAAAVLAGDLGFSDPANTLPPPAWAVGQAERGPDLDALPGFKQPPRGFGIVPFFWWLGDPLTKERLGWELQQMEGMGMAGFQINYAHSDHGGRSWGLTYPSDPPLFSEDWWNLTGWFLREAKKLGASVSLSDYTLGFGQGWYVDEAIKENPDLNGATLSSATQTAAGGQEIAWVLPKDTIAVTAYALNDKNQIVAPGTDLRKSVREGKLQWNAPAGRWQIFAVFFTRAPWSIDPMNPKSGPKIIEKFFQRFEDRNPGEGGKGLNFFFSDELGFGVSGNLWTDRFAEEFQKRKGYDVVPELPALFADIGPRTPKVRLDYRDVVVSLSEECYFRPVFDWHQKRGMTYGCDHGGRGHDVVEFGDYFRTQRWNQGPGSDQPGLGKELIKAKVASSIAHLYQRPRVWLEGYYGSGWGTSSAAVVDATFADFVMGYNLLSLHGMYYATHGGWWEWAPPDNTFRMPYWKHLRAFTDCVQRLSYLLSQGHHRCDVAILYPVAPMQAGMDGPAAVHTAFAAGQQLYGRSVDFDFIDFESVARAKVAGKELQVSGEAYRVLVLPAMKAVRHSTLQKALEFHRAGGVVVALGALPEASDRLGRDDPEVAAMVKELFPDGPTKDLFARLPGRDYEGPGYIQHRKIGPRDLYAIYNAPQGAECRFRSVGKVELWDPWTGTAAPLAVTSQDDAGTRLRLPLTAKEIQLIVFSPGAAEVAAAQSEKPATAIAVEGDWEFELQPTCDNRYGDFHWPPTPGMIGAEARQLWYCEGDKADGPWRKVTCSFGPKFLLAAAPPEATLAPPAQSKPYEFSWRWGIEGNPGRQGYHGLKEIVHDDFLNVAEKGSYFWTTIVAPREMAARALTGALKPAKVWLNGTEVAGDALNLKAGPNALVLYYDKPGRTYFVAVGGKGAAGKAAAAKSEVFSPAAFWIWYPGERITADRLFSKKFQLHSAPAQAKLRITCDNAYRVLINGKEIGRGNRWEAVQEYDVSESLRAGGNEILVEAHNDGDAAGLIAELTAGDTRIATDRTWLAAQTAGGPTVQAEEVAAFATSLWYKHPNGPPRLEAAAGAAVAQPFVVSPLTMRWASDPDVLPFDVRPNEKTPVGWYRFTSPPGLRAITVTARGKVQAWADDKPMAGGDAPTGGVFRVAEPSPRPATVLLRIEQERGCYGGAALPEPIRLDCGKGQMALGDWAANEGLLSYSGGAWYRKTVSIPAGREVTLDLGGVAASAEVRINGQLAGVKVAPPWTLNISKLVKPGENRIEILVCNTLANHYTTVPTNYRGSTVSGLLGPVTIRVAP